MMHTDTTPSSSLFLFRATTVFCMVLLCAAATIYVETESLSLWNDRTVSVVLITILFVLCYGGSLWALHDENQQVQLILLWIELALISVLCLIVNNSEVMHYFAGFWVARAPYSYGLRACVFLTLGVITLTVFASMIRGLELPIWLLVVLVPAYMSILSISYTAVSERRLRQRMTVLYRELESAHHELANASRNSERLRIARDMHDVLGHQLTALVLQLELCSHKVREPQLQPVESALTLARMAIRDLRNVVTDLRESAKTDLKQTLDTMLSHIPGLNIQLECDERVFIEDKAIVDALQCCVQEAITNTVRHANARICIISLREHEGQMLLEVRDDGSCPAEIEPGNGLCGMRERLEQLAGTLRWRNHDGSFVLQASLPLRNGSRA